MANFIGETASLANSSQNKKFDYKIWFLNGSFIFLVIALAFFSLNSFLARKQPIKKIEELPKKTIISGKIDFNGVAPPGSLIAIGERIPGKNQFTIFARGIDPVDGASWSWSDAQPGQNYDLQAYLEADSTAAASSEVLTVTAPAKDEVLIINAQPKIPPPEPAEISGTFNLNGYIPSQSTITILATGEEQTSEQIVAQGIKPVDQGSWSWTGAEKGKPYKLKAILEEAGQEISNSNEVTLVAPAANEVLSVNSRAAPPPPPAPTKGTISGKINLNGPSPLNSRIVVLARVEGTKDFKVAVDNLNSIDGTPWVWNDADTGKKYEILGVLKVRQPGNNDDDFAYSSQLAVSAPANNEILTINTALSLSAPTSLPAVSCGTDGSQQVATITLASISGASQYWLQLGTKDGTADFMDSRIAATTFSQPDVNHLVYKANVNANTWYYARYAWAKCTNCGALTDFSVFSHSQSFICPSK